MAMEAAAAHPAHPWFFSVSAMTMRGGRRRSPAFSRPGGIMSPYYLLWRRRSSSAFPEVDSLYHYSHVLPILGWNSSVLKIHSNLGPTEKFPRWENILNGCNNQNWVFYLIDPLANRPHSISSWLELTRWHHDSRFRWQRSSLSLSLSLSLCLTHTHIHMRVSEFGGWLKKQLFSKKWHLHKWVNIWCHLLNSRRKDMERQICHTSCSCLKTEIGQKKSRT